jgi:hypothetical protein
MHIVSTISTCRRDMVYLPYALACKYPNALPGVRLAICVPID